VAPDGTVVDVTAGWLLASLRQAASTDGPLELPCRAAEIVVPGAITTYRIPLVTNARRFAAGHSIRLVLTSDDQDDSTPAIMGFRHAPVGTSRNTIHSSSKLVLPVAGQKGTGT
jgi:predicted acyl esterase